MNTVEKTYPSWIKYFLGITATFSLIKAFVTLFTNLMLYDTSFAISIFIGSILLFSCIMLIINKKFYGYVMYVVLLLCEYPLSLYLFGSVHENVYYVIFVRLILISILVFVPFKRGHSIFEAMQPIGNPLSFFRNIHSVWMSVFKPSDSDKNTVDEMITMPSTLQTSHATKYIFKCNSPIIKIGFGLIGVFGICVGLYFGISYLLRGNCQEAYFIDENDFIHADANCSSIKEQSELILSKDLFQQAVSPQNIVLPQNGLHYCGKCFKVSEIHIIQDSISAHIHQNWGTLDSDTIKWLANDINWYFKKFKDTYNWKNSTECLRYFKNSQKALRFYTKNCKDWDIGTPSEFMSLWTPILSQHPSKTELEYLDRRKYVYEILRNNNYEMEEFNDYLNHISDPIRRERLYHTLITDEGCYDASIPLESYSSFQNWMGY